jgi:hypothetical protein
LLDHYDWPVGDNYHVPFNFLDNLLNRDRWFQQAERTRLHSLQLAKPPDAIVSTLNPAST